MNWHHNISFKMPVLYPTSRKTVFDPWHNSQTSSRALLSTCVKFRQEKGRRREQGCTGGAAAKGAIKRQRGIWKRKRSLIWREMEQEIVVWGIICGGGGEQEEKSNHNLKGLVWRGAIYQRMILKALSFFLSPYSAPSGSRVVEAERERKGRAELTMIKVSGGLSPVYLRVH